MGTKNVYNHGKKGLDIKYAPGYIQYAGASSSLDSSL